MVIITRKMPDTGEVRSFWQDGYLNTMFLGFQKAIEKHNTSVVIIIDGRSGMGKTLLKGSKILMSNGEWKNIEDVKIGEEVISPQKDGSFVKAKVTGTHNRFEQEIYDVYELGREKKLLYSCAWNHEIPFFRTESHRISGTEKRKINLKLEIREVRDLAKMKKGYATSFTTTAVDYGNKDSKIDAYTLGVYLGDGSFSSLKKFSKDGKGSSGFWKHRQLNINNSKPEILEYISKVYPISKIYFKTSQKNRKSTMMRFSLEGEFAKELEQLGLEGKTSGNKFIPKECLLSSIEYRRKLLAGLIDTDGYIEKHNSIVYTTKSKRLAQDIYDLVFSLGGHSRIREIRKKCQGWTERKLYYSVKISFEDPRIIPLLSDKKKRLGKMKNNPRHVTINVVKRNPAEVYGIIIDSPSKWHVTDNWMVTHNTTFGNQTGITLDEDYGLHKIFYNPQDFLKALSKAKKGDCIMFDEAMLISSRSALSTINKMIIQAMSMIRSKRIYIIFCVNSFFDLDRNLAISRADLLLHVFGQSLVERGRFGAFFRGQDGHDRIKELYLLGKKLYSYSLPRSNFHGKFAKEFVVDEDKYEKLKQIGVSAFLSKKVGTATARAYETRNNLIRSLHKSGWSCQKLANETGLALDTVQAICIEKSELKEVTEII